MKINFPFSTFKVMLEATITLYFFIFALTTRENILLSMYRAKRSNLNHYSSTRQLFVHLLVLIGTKVKCYLVFDNL